MLYDTKWDIKSKPSIYSLEGLIAWMETQDPKTKYDWRDCRGGCLIGLYFKAMGLPEHITDYHRVFGESPWRGDYGRVCSSQCGPTTIGAALDRARAVQAKRMKEATPC